MRTEGIVIKTVDYGEGNKIITLFTETHGKVPLMARGAKKTKSRLSSVSQLFSYGDYTFFLTKSMGTLNHGEIIQSFTKIQQDIIKTAYAAYLVELTDKMTENLDPISYLYQQLLSSLKQIDEGKDPEIIIRIYELKILKISGYRPVLNQCVLCHSVDNLTRFSIVHGGVICDHHSDDSSIVLQEGTMKMLRLFEKIDIRRIGNTNVKASTKSQLQYVLRSFIEHHVGIQLKSQNFLDQLKQFE
ncbi:DNA repair protein RecO [Tepidibacillus fermentans]|uniref:DNA repair protein RecO n=1 Tax=Tepidibacillus fermentans TaxID=1281767 RepID=UPI001FB2738D|nr:DNA repair protein RecO [Tepidibacillus fermentans]